MITSLALAIYSQSIFLSVDTAYILNSKSDDRPEVGEIRLSTPGSAVLWGGYISNPGELHLEANATGTNLQILVHGTGLNKKLNGSVGDIVISKPGWYTLTFSGTNAQIAGVNLTGTATEGAKFNLKTRRNAASVHIGYPQAAGQEVEWFYNEIQAKTDPLHTYYMACGFARGYFGMQVNSKTERRVIFSVWDAGKEAVDRNKVDEDNKVRLLAKGAGVFADGFGNEGTGGHSHLVTNWKTDRSQRFLVHAQKDGTGTIYTGYYFMPDTQKWSLIASFRAPKDGKLLRGLYSFNENFWGDNGHLKRAAEFGPTWIRTTDGVWKQMTTGRFTHDVTGGKDRFDYDLTSTGSKWLLQNGGFEGSSPKLGTLVELKKTSPMPKIDLQSLPVK